MKDPTIDQVGIRLRFVHASPNAAAVQFRLNEENVHTPPLAYRDTTGYIALEGGTYRVSLTSGTREWSNTVMDFTPLASYSVFAIDSANKLNFAVAKDDLTLPLMPLRAHLRFFNLVPGSNALSLVTIRGADTAVFSRRDFNDLGSSATAGNFQPVPSDVYEMLLFSGNTLLFRLPPQVIANNKIYTIYARGLLTGTGSQAVSLGILKHN